MMETNTQTAIAKHTVTVHTVGKEKTYEEVIAEGRAAREREYSDKLVADGKPLYTHADVIALGYVNDPTWTQMDLQERMTVGPVMLPLETLRSQASETHKLFVAPGREAIRGIVQEAYKLYLLATEPERAAATFRAIREHVQRGLKQKLRDDTSQASLLVQYVFDDMSDKKRHLYSKALEYARYKNVAVSGFSDFVAARGGFEGVRREAAEALNKTPEKAAEAAAKTAHANAVHNLLNALNNKKRNSPALTVQVPPDAAKRLGASSSSIYLEAVWDGINLAILGPLNRTDDLDAAVVASTKKFIEDNFDQVKAYTEKQ